MSLTLDLPDLVARALNNQPDASRHALESIVADLYRDAKMTRGEVREALGLSWHQAEEFLARKGCERHYTLSDLESDWETNQRILSKD